ncbi:MAG TPA: ethanolamine ammonia-lyase subunit EutC [Ramlibacter sp.]|jgi:ethanolamine ammonia-lyase small subunit|uniref:ethanolamine ammonia-lyase subunit EutC n=1 Tax=Ramlibacter sp. TaxID=1917967 RepID=UPI002D48E2EE|nr:ethanolamine ammonia-lyase subunit EutC [Ramlibacter sp.]HZY18511.1 ethanolamine ammonia-lyase subunit EutC [Ramlibacter sp.]
MQHDERADAIRWDELRRFTPARIGLGRSGVALPTREVLDFGLAHARARDAVHAPLDTAALAADLRAAGFDVVQARSRAPDRATYLRRPDLGRQLDPDAQAALRARGTDATDLALVIGDGLSSLAVQRHAAPLLLALKACLPQHVACSPVVVVQQARVAVGDDVGEALQARLVAVLVGERPGLGSPDSLGIYLTHAPRRGRHDAERNCISNVRPEGLPSAPAACKLAWLVVQALQRGLTGVGLKDESDGGLLPADPGGGALPGSA